MAMQPVDVAHASLIRRRGGVMVPDAMPPLRLSHRPWRRVEAKALDFRDRVTQCDPALDFR